MNVRLTQLPVKILLSLVWIILASPVAYSQSANMSDVTLPSPDSMISDPPVDDPATTLDEPVTPTEEVTETPVEEVTETPVEEPTTPTDEVTQTPTEEPTTPTDEVTQTPTEEPTTPTDEVTQTPTEESTTPTDEVTQTPTEEPTTPTDEVTQTPTEEPTTPTEEVTQTPTEEPTTPTEEVTQTPTEEPTTPTEEVTQTAVDENTDIDTSNTAEDLGADTGADIVQESVTNSIDANSEIETLDVDISNFESGTIENETPTLEEAAATEKLAESNDIVKKLFDQADEREISRDQEAKKDQIEKEKVAEERNPTSTVGQVDRVAYEVQFQSASSDLAIAMQEEFQLNQLIDASGIELYGSVPSTKQISHRLAQLAQQTGKKPAFINISLQENQLESIVVLPEQGLQANADNSLVASSKLNSVAPSPASKALTIRKTIKDTSRKDILAKAAEFRAEVGDIRKLNQDGYKQSSQELYNVLIKPLEAELEANGIDVLVFSMDSGLRLLPVAALYDGKQFLIEKYAMGMVPSFGLTDTRYVSPENNSILAMGASEFRQQPALPTMPIELKTIVSNPRRGESFLNQQFTIPNFVAQNRRKAPFSIIHLGTHAEFKIGDLNDSYIQFYDNRLKIPQLQRLSDQLGWSTSDTPIELLVLSACETALGDKDAELGFAGLSVQAGVKSALASLWYVSDLGTLAMMGEFYDQLGDTLNKSEALRQTQLRMLRGNVKVDSKHVKLSNGTNVSLPADFPDGALSLDHPYFWSAFTLIGNWN
jgi:CHAT domain-containing protein